jgi:hypothetical protein
MVFKFYYWNCNGLMRQARLVQLKSFLTTCAVAPDLMCIAEVKLANDSTIDFSDVNYKHCYFPYLQDSSGLLFIYKNGMQLIHRQDLSLLHMFNNIPHATMLEWMEVLCDDMTILIGGLYRHPSALIDESEYMLNNIKQIIDLDIPFFLLGDFNSHGSYFDSQYLINDVHADKLYDFIVENDLCLLNSIYASNVATHHVGNIHNVLDLGICNKTCFVEQFNIEDEFSMISDHSVISIYLSLAFSDASYEFQYWDFKKADFISYKLYLTDLLNNVDLSELKILSHNDMCVYVNKYVESVTNCLHDAASIYIGKRTFKNNIKHYYNDDQVKICFSHMHNVHKLYKKHYNNLFYKNLYYNSLFLYKQAVHVAKLKHMNTLVSRLESANKHIVWSSWIHLSYKVINYSLPFLDQALDMKTSINRLAQHFASISSNSIVDYKLMPDKQKRSYILLESEVDTFKSSVLDTFVNNYNVNIPFTLDDVKNECINCRLSGIGVDDLHKNFFIHGGDKLYQVLYDLFSLCFKCSIFPSSWKMAKVVPVYKRSGSKFDLNNYRPISVTCVLSRMFEHLLLKHLQSIIMPLINVKQAGFREKYSTLDQFYILQEKLLQARRLDIDFPCLFIDINKAFDTVWTDALLYKLHKMNVDLSFIKLLQSFFHDRKIYVKYKDIQSDCCNICFGVPQGSILSPILFCVFINDMFNVLHNDVEMLLYADDVVVFPKNFSNSYKFFDILQDNLSIMFNWCCANILKINCKKSNVVVFSCHNVDYTHKTKLQLCHNEYIDYATHYKYVGITLQANYSFELYETYLMEKLNKVKFCLLKLCERGIEMAPNILRILVQAIMYGSCGYGLALWRPSKKFELFFNRTVIMPFRYLLHLPSTVSIDSMLQEFKLFPLFYLRQWYMYLYFNRILAFDATFPARMVLIESKFVNTLPYMEHKSLSKASLYTNLNKYSKLVENSQSLVYDLICINLNDLFSSNLSRNAVKKSLFNLFVAHADDCKMLREITTSSADIRVPLYFKYLSLTQFEYLLKFRFDLIPLNASIINRHVFKNNELKCSTCNVLETRQHVLMECKLYEHERSLFIQHLQAMDINIIDLKLFCGELFDNFSSVQLYEQYITYLAQFLQSVVSSRFI